MATTGIHNGHYMRWFIDGTAILKARSGSISFNKETREITHKDQTGSWAERSTGTRSFSGSCEAYLAEGETLEDLWDSFDELNSATEELTMEFST